MKSFFKNFIKNGDLCLVRQQLGGSVYLGDLVVVLQWI